MKLLYKAPLPFLGQKRNWIRYLPELINGNLFEKGFSNYKKGVWVDMFGGSGLLSYNIKQLCPDAEVIYNDFDGYTDYLNDECINIFKEVIKNLYEKVLCKYKIEQKIKPCHCKYIFKALNYFRSKYQNKIYFKGILNFIMFSGGNKYIEDTYLKNQQGYWNRLCSTSLILTNKFNKDCQNYLDNLTITKGVDFKQLIQQYKDNKNAVFVCDPPYLNTYSGNYKSGFDKNNFDFLVENIRPPFIAFSSMKNNLKELLLTKFPNAKYKEFDVFLGSGKNKTERNTNDQMIYYAGD